METSEEEEDEENYTFDSRYNKNKKIEISPQKKEAANPKVEE